MFEKKDREDRMEPNHGPGRASALRTVPAVDGQDAGWSLLEMMVVLTLAGLLVVMAWPSDADHLRRMRRLDAQHSLQALHLAQTRWRSQTGEFAVSLTTLGWTSALSADGHYRLEIASAHAGGYVLLATGVGPQARDQACNPMRLQLKDRASLVLTGGPGQDRQCWR